MVLGSKLSRKKDEREREGGEGGELGETDV